MRIFTLFVSVLLFCTLLTASLSFYGYIDVYLYRSAYSLSLIIALIALIAIFIANRISLNKKSSSNLRLNAACIGIITLGFADFPININGIAIIILALIVAIEAFANFRSLLLENRHKRDV